MDSSALGAMGSLLGAAVSAVAALVSVWHARKAGKIHLYEIRDAVFDAVMGFLVEPNITGKAYDVQRLFRFRRETRQVEHLFGKEAQRLVDEIYDAAVKVRRAHLDYDANPSDSKLCEEFSRCDGEFRQFQRKVEKVFGYHLSVI